MENVIFKPKYKKSVYWFLILTPLISWPIVLKMVFTLKIDLELFFPSLIAGLISIFIPFAVYKRMIFCKNALILERYLLPSKTINYSDIKGIGLTMIQAKRWTMVTYNILNASELIRIFNEKIDEGSIPEDQLSGSLVRKEISVMNASLYCIPITIIVWICLYFTKIMPTAGYGLIVLGMSTYLLCFTGVYCVLRYKQNKDR